MTEKYGDEVLKGGAGSGHHGHSGRPGKVGGSQPGDGETFRADDPRGHESVSDKKKRDYEQHMARSVADTDSGKAVYDLASMEEAAAYAKAEDIHYQDVLNQGFIWDLESNIKMDPYEWEKYKKDPIPYHMDMLLDYGKWPASFSDLEFEEKRAVAVHLAVRLMGYHGRINVKELEMTEEKKQYFGEEVLKGGAGSGHHGHSGLSGVWGGSRPSGADKGGGGQGGPPKKKKPEKHPIEPFSGRVHDRINWREPYEPKIKPKVNYDEEAAEDERVEASRIAAEAEETYGDYKPLFGKSDVLSEQDMLDAGAERIGSGHIDFYAAADLGVGTVPKGAGLEIGDDLDVYYRGNKVTGIVQVIRDYNYDVKIDAEDYPGHGNVVSFQYYPEENKEFTEEKCSDGKKKYGDKIIHSSEKDDDEDEE